MEAGSVAPQKAHRASRAKEKSKKKKASSQSNSGKRQAVAKPGAFARRIRLTADRSEKRVSNPTAPVDRTGGDAAPRLVTVIGPKGVGKSTIIRNLVKHYSKRSIPTITGPITIVAGRKKRITFLEVGNDLSSMIDAAKIADLVLLVIDASYGFEMETFEFLNIAATHGMPKIMTILTHLDKLKDGKQLRNAKKTFKDRIWAELYDGAKVFYLSGITTTGDYLNREVLNLARFISVTKYANIKWRADHPYVLADRVEDITPKSLPDYANRSVAAYGYIRGSPLRLSAGQWRIHLAGVGDLIANNVEMLPDPCPAPEDTSKGDGKDGSKKKRKVGERERLVHAPMAPEVDGISYDRDAVYINIAEKDLRFSDKSTIVKSAEEGAESDSDGEDSSDGEGEKMVKTLQKTDGKTVDENLKRSSLQLLTGGKKITSEEYTDKRERRRANFDNISEESDDEETDEEDSDASDADKSEQNNNILGEDKADVFNDHDDDDDSQDEVEEGDQVRNESDSDDDESDEDRTERRWKALTLSNASKRLHNSSSPSKVLFRMIYQKNADGGEYKHDIFMNSEEENGDSKVNPENDSDDDFFKPRRKTSNNDGQESQDAITLMEDTTRLLPIFVRDWASDDALCRKLKKARFGTGQLEGETIDQQNSDEEVVDGDFEDLETGEVHHGRDGGASDGSADDESDDGPETIQSKKIKKKEMFNAEFDKRRGKAGANDSDDEDNSIDKRKEGNSQRDNEDRAPDLRKLERERLDKIRDAELQGLDDETRIAMEGILPGQYVRLEIQEVPMEFVKYFNPRFPVVIGGLKPSDDDGKTYVRARIRRHRFKRGVLKSSDPIIFSIGWRRFQSMPIYDTEDQGGRRRFLKYTPEYLHCSATFWAPGVAPGAGVVLCQSLGRSKASFRIAGTGVVTEVNNSVNIVKKLKLTGEPVKVHKNTAFVKGMFNSEMEASKYIGASIRTVSGIRGTVKKAISETAQRGGLDRDVAKSPPGTFRAGFEDKILLSDIVFLRAWVPVDVKRFCSIATTLLEPGTGDGTWRMRTVREVRQANEMSIPLQQDSLYKAIERGTPVFAPLKISKKLESSLPYASKPKLFAQKKTKKPQSDRAAAIAEERAVILEKSEKKEQRLLQSVYTIRNERLKKRKEATEKRLARKKKEWDMETAKHEETSTRNKKRKFALQGAKEANDAKKRRGDDD